MTERVTWKLTMFVLVVSPMRWKVTPGRLGNCGDIAVLDGYFEALDERVRGLLHDGVGLAELTARCELPQFASWDRYPDLHMQNANRAYLRLERALFLN